jgi:hypothetical protein
MAQPNDTQSEKIPDQQKRRVFPLGAEWAKKRGIELPKPFGVSTFFTYMSRGVDVTDVTVEFGGGEPESINEFASFAVKNQTYVNAIRFDTWILPVVNVYVLAGYAFTNANLDAQVTIDRSILPKPPVEIDIKSKQSVKGPYTGIGTSLVAGYKSWFVIGDANYGKTWPDLLNNTVNFTLLSLRSGFSGEIGGKNSIRSWLGAAYMDSKCTLEILETSDVLGEVLVKIDQQPVHPWTYQCGFSLGFGKSFEFMTELGSNFDDASMLVLNASYRF